MELTVYPTVYGVGYFPFSGQGNCPEHAQPLLLMALDAQGRDLRYCVECYRAALLAELAHLDAVIGRQSS